MMIKIRKQFLDDLNESVGTLPYNYNIMTNAGNIPLREVMDIFNNWNDGDCSTVNVLEGALQAILCLPYNIIKNIGDILLSEKRFELYLEYIKDDDNSIKEDEVEDKLTKEDNAKK